MTQEALAEAADVHVNVVGRLERGAEDRLLEDAVRLKDRATKVGRQEMQRRLRGLMAFFRKQRIELRDMKLLLHPVDYVVFRGLSEQRCRGCEFLDGEANSITHEGLQRSIERAVAATATPICD